MITVLVLAIVLLVFINIATAKRLSRLIAELAEAHRTIRSMGQTIADQRATIERQGSDIVRLEATAPRGKSKRI
jgi:Sec-independent protein translocase protein TatA